MRPGYRSVHRDDFFHSADLDVLIAGVIGSIVLDPTTLRVLTSPTGGGEEPLMSVCTTGAGTVSVSRRAVGLPSWAALALSTAFAVLAPPLGFALATAALGAAAIVDARTERIPNRVLAFALAATIGAAFTREVVHQVALGAAVAALPLVVVLLSRGIGIGDVKMATVVGAVAGLVHPLCGLAAVFVAALGAGLSGVVLRVRRAPFAPWLFAGLVVAVVSSWTGWWP
jgi:leader peptidase (prepilin peptidase) / N-methyltransferase